jgi:hypothetical protein
VIVVLDGPGFLYEPVLLSPQQHVALPLAGGLEVNEWMEKHLEVPFSWSRVRILF